MKKIIILSGKKQTGKSLSFKIIAEECEKWGLKVEEAAFAEPLKTFCINALGLSYEQCYGTDAEKDGLTDWRWDDLHYDIRCMNGASMDTPPPRESNKNFAIWRRQSDGKWLWPRMGLMTGREVMQIIGTDIMREFFHQDIWVKAAVNKALKNKSNIVIFTDCRFPNEADVAKTLMAAFSIRLNRNAAPNDDTHKSEISLDNYEGFTYNIKAEDKTELREKLLEILKKEGVIK